MDVIPVLYLSEKFKKNEVSPLYLRDIMKKQGFSELYIIDEQGIRRNEPQYAFYQRFSALFDLLVDTGPREIGDVVDDIFSGAKRIIIRENLWTEESLSRIRELTDHEIFLAVDKNRVQDVYNRPLFYDEADGLVLYMTSEKEQDFKNESKINQLIKNKTVYVFDEEKNESFWSSRNVKGLLRDINSFV